MAAAADTTPTAIEPLFDTNDVAAAAKLSPRTVERRRAEGTGPEFVRIGRSIRYEPSAVRAWIARLRCAR